MDMTNKPFANAADAFRFAMGGNATITLMSKATGNHFTFKIQAPHHEGNQGTNARRDVESDFRFVSLMNGPDNELSFAYFGYIRRGVFFHGGAKARVGVDAPSVKAFTWGWQKIVEGALQSKPMPESLSVYHEGRCGVCNRKLTVPSSIESGIGPECAGRTGFFATAVEG
jgi:hypothetical protein